MTQRQTFTRNDYPFALFYSGGSHHFRHAVELHPHCHPSGPELTIVLSGEAHWQLPGGETFCQGGGTIGLMPRNCEHQGRQCVIMPCDLYWFVLDLENRGTAEGGFFSPTFRERLRRDFSAMPPAVAPLPPEVANCCRRWRECADAPETEPEEFRLLWATILFGCHRALRERPGAPPATSLTAQAHAAMLKQLHRNDLTIDHIAAACGCSESAFTRRFRRESGISVLDYLLRLRVETAQKRLLDGNGSISRLAGELGFATSQYFATVFKRYTGLSPREFRLRRPAPSPLREKR